MHFRLGFLVNKREYSHVDEAYVDAALPAEMMTAGEAYLLPLHFHTDAAFVELIHVQLHAYTYTYMYD